jgi:hypothetical protein
MHYWLSTKWTIITPVTNVIDKNAANTNIVAAAWIKPRLLHINRQRQEAERTFNAMCLIGLGK